MPHSEPVPRIGLPDEILTWPPRDQVVEERQMVAGLALAVVVPKERVDALVGNWINSHSHPTADRVAGAEIKNADAGQHFLY